MLRSRIEKGRPGRPAGQRRLTGRNGNAWLQPAEAFSVGLAGGGEAKLEVAPAGIRRDNFAFINRNNFSFRANSEGSLDREGAFNL